MGDKFIARVSTAELSQALKSIDAYDGQSRLRVEKALQDGTKRIAGGARQRVAVRSGKTKKAIRTGFSRAKLEGYVKAGTRYAHIIEFGAKPHKITKKKKVLVVKGQPISGDIQHPGAKSRPFMRPAFESEASNITKDVLKAVQKI